MIIVIETCTLKKSFNLEINNIPHLVNYLEEFDPEVWKRIKNLSLVFGLIDSTEKLKPVSLYPEAINSSLDGYDILIIGEKVEGDFAFTALAAAITASIATSLSALSLSIGLGVAGLAGVAGAIGTIGAGLIFAGIAYALGQVLQMISPHQSMSGDPSSQQKSLVFNGIPNVDEQGGAVPLIIGNCLFGGVKIGQIVHTYDIEVDAEPEPDHSVTQITESNIKNAVPGKWYRVV